MSDDYPDDIQQVPATTPDFQTELARKLQELAPEAITDGKVDTHKLKELLDGDTADDTERFGLFWPGKKRAMRAAQEPTTATLKPAKDESKDWDTTQNIFIEGDNLEVLKILQKYYHNRIKMIYIDPPYNTGKDFVYPDNYKEGLASYLEFTRQVDEEGRKVSTNSDTDGRYHSNWLSMMYPRLKLARNLLADDGAIFLSIDDHEYDNLIKICNEIFGENNFIASFPRVTKKAGKSSDKVARNNDYVIAYARSDRVKLNRFEHDDPGFKHEDEYVDQRGKYKLNQALDYDTLGYVKSLDYKIEIDGRTFYPGGVSEDEQNKRREENPKDGFRWRWSKEKFEFGLSNGFVVVSNSGRIYTKTYQNCTISKSNDGYYIEYTGRTKSISTLEFTDNIYSNDNARKNITQILTFAAFDYTKPVELIKVLTKLGTDTDSVVLDFFSGSSTTAHAVMQLNAEDDGMRRHIQVQLPEPTEENSEAYKSGYKNIAEIARERIRRAGEKIKQDYAEQIAQRETPLDTGFKVFKLADTNFTKWRTSSDIDKDAVQQQLLDIRESSNDAATEEDLLTEVLLKQGISLTAKIGHQDISGLSVWNIGDTTVLAYLNEEVKPNLDQLRAIADAEPAKIIVLEDAFHGDDELKTNLAQICKTNKIELWTV